MAVESLTDVKEMSKITIVDRKKRIVRATINDKLFEFQLSPRPRCNAGDTQYIVNFYVSRENYAEAWQQLRMRAVEFKAVE